MSTSTNSNNDCCALGARRQAGVGYVLMWLFGCVVAGDHTILAFAGHPAPTRSKALADNIQRPVKLHPRPQNIPARLVGIVIAKIAESNNVTRLDRFRLNHR